MLRITGLVGFVLVAGVAHGQLGGAVENFDLYPLLATDRQSHYLSSFDRTGGNDDGFDGTYSALYVDENGEHVIFDATGPGAIYTFWFTSRVNGWSPLGFGRIKFYFDNEDQPRLDLDADELFSGRHPPFAPPFAYHNKQSSGGYVSYVPLPFARRLKITTENRVGFYNIYYQSFAPGSEVESWTGREDLSALRRMWRQPGVDPKPEREARVFQGRVALPGPQLPDGEPQPGRETLLEHRGAGSVRSLKLNPLFPLTAYELQHIWLRISFDGESEPSVDTPLGSFFGSGLGEASVRAVPLGMSPSGEYYCYLPMPFWESLKIELVNENPQPTPEIWWEVQVTPESELEYSRETSGTFHAKYRREWPTTPDQDYLLLESAGRGVHVGQVMTVEPLRPELKRWWEGDLRLYLDGRRQPAFHGTGHEDEYLGGWSNEWLMSPYSLPMHGEPNTTELKQVDFQWSAATTVYRFFVGGVPFQAGISLSTEHGARNTATAMYSSVAYYYENSRPMVLADAIDVGDLQSEEAHGYRAGAETELVTLESEPEGRESGGSWTDQGRRVEGSSTFTLSGKVGNRGVRLRRLFDQAERHRAEVWLNDERVGIWQVAATNAVRRWAESDFLLPATATSASDLKFEIRVLSGAWNEYRYELWAIP